MGRSKDVCLICGKRLLYGHKTNYCAQHRPEGMGQERIDAWLETGKMNYSVNTTVKGAIRDYIFNRQNKKCAICGITAEWNGKKLNFILDHIDGDASNSSPENVRLICPNCDSQLDTYKSKNRHSARTARDGLWERTKTNARM